MDIFSYIATFFALDGANEDFSIFALNVNALESFDRQRFGDEYVNFKKSVFISVAAHKENFIYSFEPYQKSERIRKQQGLFIVPSFINKTIDEILIDYHIQDGKLGGKDVAIKLIFKKERYYEILAKIKTHEYNP